MTALILFSHGSLLCGAGEALELHAKRLQERGDFSIVEIGYLNYSEPLFPDTVRKVVAAGATSVIVAPYFLVSGFFVNKCLEEVAKARQAFPDVTFTVSEALGEDDELVDALLESALSAHGPESWRDGLVRASRSCRPSPDCPLYGTPDCPKVKEPVHA